MTTFDACLHRVDLDGAMAVLDELKTGHAGTPPQAVKDKAIKRIRTVYARDHERLLGAGILLSESGSPGAREIGISLLPPCYASATSAIDERFLRIGDDRNWEVREWAASALAHVISGDFDLICPRLRQWTIDPSSNVRRMVVVAVGYSMRDCTERQCRQLLDLLTPLMTDAAAYVSKNLGQFALGSYAIRYRADLVAEWALSLNPDDLQTAWNLAMMFTTAEGAKRVLSFQVVFASLVRDDRKAVQGAISKAVRNIAKRNEPALIAILARWETSPATRDSASRVNTLLDSN